MDYSSLAKDVQSMLQEAGIAVTFMRHAVSEVEPDFNVEAGEYIERDTTPPVSYPVNAVITSPNRRGEQYLAGVLIESGDRLLIVEAKGFVPSPGDEVVVSGEKYAVVASDPISPGGVDLLYKTLVRR